MSASSPDSESTQSSSGYEDGLGRRVLAFDRETGDMLERLVLRPELSAFEPALKERMAIVAGLEDERFMRPRTVERDADDRLTVVSEFVTGRRLSDVLDAAAEHGIIAGLDSGLGLLLELLPALARLHDAGLAHGALAPGRVLITPAGQLALLDSIYADPLERLKLTRRRLWAEFRLAFPSSAGVVRFDKGADLGHAAMVAAALTVGRPLRDDDYPDGIPALRQEILEIASIRGSKGFSDAVDKFFAGSLPLAGRRGPASASADEAAIDLRKLVRKELGITTCRTALVEFFQQVDLADAERIAAEAAQQEARAETARGAAVVVHEPALVDTERQAREQAETERAERERAETARLETERGQRERLEAERAEHARLEAERIEREHLEAQRAEQARLEAERLERERAEKARLEADRIERERLEAERVEHARLEAERIERERLEAERAEKARLEAERLERERAEKARLEAERIERERLEAERAEKARLEAERLERERIETARIEKARIEAERLERERIEAERAEKARLEAERLERERIEKARLEAERIERERLEAERAEKARLEAERLERERIEKARLEAERLERERIEAERAEKARLEAERLERERIEKARLEAERIERERLEAERAEKARLEAERLERERIEKARLEAERIERERLEAERAEKARLEAERLEAERADAERRERELLEAARTERERAEKARADADRLERERAEQARLEAEREEQDELEERNTRARIEAERVAAEQASAEQREREQERTREQEREQERKREQEHEREQERAREQERKREQEREREREKEKAPAAGGWLVPPDRASKFEPVVQEAPPQVAPTARSYPIYVPPSDSAAWSADLPLPDALPSEVEPVAGATPIPLASATPASGTGAIRFRDEASNPFASAPARSESRSEPEEMSAAGAYEPFRTTSEPQAVPWKLIAAGVVLIGATVAITKGFAPSSAMPIIETVRKAAPKTPPAEPAPPAPIAGNAGRLTVTTEPAGAKVTLDGKAAGETPLTLDTVKPGRHTIVVTAASGATAKRTVRVESGQTLAVDVPLFSGFAAISAPFILDVSENGKALGTSEDQILLSPGSHRLRVGNKDLGYVGAETVEIQAGEVTRLSLDPRGRANINAAPWAEVWIDGERAGDTPLANVAIRLGVREIVFKNPQFGERKVTTTIKANAPATISIDFSK